jgi:hypothetical protein
MQFFGGFRTFLFGLGGPSISLPNFSFLLRLEVGDLFWTIIHTFAVVYRDNRWLAEDARL